MLESYVLVYYCLVERIIYEKKAEWLHTLLKVIQYQLKLSIYFYMF